MTNTQAAQAGKEADAIIEQLANPGGKVETNTNIGAVDVLDQSQPVRQPNESKENWEKRFKNYKASTDKTIHSLRQKAQQFDLLQSQNAKMQQQIDQLSQSTQQPDPEVLKHFSEEEVESVKKMFEGQVGKLTSQVDYLKGQLTLQQQREADEQALRAHQHVVNAVKGSVPNYDLIDKDPRFKTFMQSPDDFGNIRFDLLLKAKNANPPDIAHIIDFYTEFAGSQPDVQQAHQQVRAEQRAQPKQFTQQELLQNPRGNPAGLTKREDTGIRWDEPTIQAFYRDKALNKISPDEAAMLEQDMVNSLYRR